LKPVDILKDFSGKAHFKSFVKAGTAAALSTFRRHDLPAMLRGRGGRARCDRPEDPTVMNAADAIALETVALISMAPESS